MKLEEKVQWLLGGKEVYLNLEEYQEASKKGLLCGIVGCFKKQTGSARAVVNTTVKNTNSHIFILQTKNLRGRKLNKA